MFVTNLAPCFGIRLHLWPDKGKSASEMAASKRVLEVTAKLVQIPSGPAPRQVLNMFIAFFHVNIFTMIMFGAACHLYSLCVLY
jgi:hypothetical protein